MSSPLSHRPSRRPRRGPKPARIGAGLGALVLLFLLAWLPFPLLAEPEVLAAEWFFDADPGPGLATPIDADPAAPWEALARLQSAAPLANLPPGLHTVSLRVQDGAGDWSLPIAQSFRLPAGPWDGDPLEGTNRPATAEAFIDTDPGPGNGTPVAVAADGALDLPAETLLGQMDLHELAKGLHTLFVRVCDRAGVWSLPIAQSFDANAWNTAPADPDGNRIVAARAWFDAGGDLSVDLAVDGGTVADPLAAATGQATLAGLAPGWHQVWVSLRDSSGEWSLPHRQSFYLSAAARAPGGPVSGLIAANYRIDVGTWQGAPAADGAFGGPVESIDLEVAASETYHRVQVRFQDDSGDWSDPDFRPTSPTVDADGNGLPDAWERTWFGAIGQDARADPDGDGRTNLDEYREGTNPLRGPSEVGGSVRGLVLDAATGEPIAGALVSGTGRSVYTNAIGFYQLSGLPAASQDVRATAAGYTGQVARLDAGAAPRRDFVLAPALRDCSAGVLSGTVRDAVTGRPLGGVQVQLRPPIGLPHSVLSAADGGFVLPEASPGTWTLGADAVGFESFREGVNVCGGALRQIAMTRTEVGLGLAWPSPYSADPVNTATGNYSLQQADLSLPGKGFGLRFVRTYNSRDRADGPLGFGWGHNLNSRLAREADGRVRIRWGDGRVETFTPDGSGGYLAQPGVFSTLEALADGGYALTTKARFRHAFDTDGRLAAISDRNGNIQTLAYTGGRLAGVTDTAGRAMALTYNAAGRIASLTDPLGRTVGYGYDAAGNLTAVTDPRGGVTRYGYDAGHLMTTATDPRGHVFVTNVYDDAGRVVTAQQDAKGAETRFDYDPDRRETRITDPLGQVGIDRFDALLRVIEQVDPLGHAKRFAYDAAGNRIAEIDANGNLTEHGYDARGNRTSTTDALGGDTAIAYDSDDNPVTRTDALGNVTRFVWDAVGNLIETLDALGGRTVQTYDAAGLLLAFTDALGQTTTHEYDAEGNRITTTDPLGNVTRFGYDAAGRRLRVIDALGRTTTTAYDDGDLVLAVTDAANQRASATYDAGGNRLTATDTLGRTTAYVWDEKDLLTATTDPLDGTVRQTYDALDRRTTTVDALGAVTQFSYDAAGRVVGVTDALDNLTASVHDAVGNLLAVTDPNGHTERLVYDALNRPVQAIDALGQVSETAYDALGRVVRVTDAAGRSSRRSYDALGRLVGVEDPAGGRLGYSYDAAGHRTGRTDPTGRVTTYAYDANGRLVEATESGGAVTRYGYDAVGNRTRVTWPDGTQVHYRYDALNRLVAIDYPDAPDLTLTYDAAGNLLGLTDGIGSTAYTYDALDRRLTATDPFGQTLGYAYDAAGRRTALTYPGNLRVTYAWDALGRMTAVADWLGRTVTYAYDPGGRLLGAALPNGTATAWGYDAADRIASLAHRRGGTVLTGDAFTLDAVGNHLAVNHTGTLEPAVPRAADLTPGTTAYGYDADQRMTAAGALALAYDPQGNLTGRDAETLRWDAADRLVQSGAGAGVTTYRYDGLGRRLERSRGGNVTRYLLDTAGTLPQVLAETDGAGQVRAWYVYGLGLVSRIAADGGQRWYHHDVRGSTLALTDAAGAVTDTYAYDPFGTAARARGGDLNPFRYLGRHGLVDDGDGLLYVRARYYEPAVGRFISKDPQPGVETDARTLQRYVYALNNPVMLVDISGLSHQETVARLMSERERYASAADFYGSVADYTSKLPRAGVEALVFEAGERITRYGLATVANANGFNATGVIAANGYKAVPLISVVAAPIQTYFDPANKNMDPVERFGRSAFSMSYAAVQSIVALQGGLLGTTAGILADPAEDAAYQQFVGTVNQGYDDTKALGEAWFDACAGRGSWCSLWLF